MNAGNRMIMQETLKSAIDEWWNGENGIPGHAGIDSESLPFIGERTFQLMAEVAVAMLEAIRDSEKTAIEQGCLEEVSL